MGETNDSRSVLNRLAALGAGQEQLQKEVERVRTTASMIFVLGLYSAGVTLLLYLLIRYPRASGGST